MIQKGKRNDKLDWIKTEHLALQKTFLRKRKDKG